MAWKKQLCNSVHHSRQTPTLPPGFDSDLRCVVQQEGQFYNFQTCGLCGQKRILSLAVVMHRTPIRSSGSVFVLSQSSSFFSKCPKLALSRSSTMLPAIQVSRLVLHPGVFISKQSGLLLMDHIKSVCGSCDSPTFCFPSHPLLFTLIIPVGSQVLITVSSTSAVYLVSLPPVGLSFQSACYSTAVLMLLPIFRYSLALHLLTASLARLMSKLFSRPQSSL